MLLEDLNEKHSGAIGDTINSLQGLASKVKDSGIIDSAKKLTTKSPSGGGTQYVTNINTPSSGSQPLPKKSKGLSTGAWIGIGIAGLTVLGIGIYLVAYKKK